MDQTDDTINDTPAPPRHRLQDFVDAVLRGEPVQILAGLQKPATKTRTTRFIVAPDSVASVIDSAGRIDRTDPSWRIARDDVVLLGRLLAGQLELVEISIITEADDPNVTVMVERP